LSENILMKEEFLQTGMTLKLKESENIYGGIMVKDSMIPFLERMKPDTMLRDDEKSGVKGGVTP